MWVTTKKIIIILIVALAVENIQAQGIETFNGFQINNPLIPKNEIRHGGPPKDGIPALDDPKFIIADKAQFLNNDDRILGILLNGVAKAYPVKILNWHEVVNDEINGRPIVITYCPLCGSGMVFHAKVNGEKRTFGVSGLLYNSDVLLYDRQTESLWSQLMSKAISGPHKSDQLRMISTQNTTWGAWEAEHPETLVLSTNTGYGRNYNRNPYDGYDQSDRIYFPVTKTSDKYHPKELVLGVTVNEVKKAYPFKELSKTDGQVIDTIGGTELIINFDKKEQSAKVITSEGDSFKTVTSFWFAWYAFNPDTRIFVAP